MKKIFCLFAAAAFAFAGCSNADEGGPDGTGVSNPEVKVAQNGQVDLSTLITIMPEGAEGELSFRITRQPSFAEHGETEWTPCGDVYTIDGTILKSSNTRVPDVVEKNTELYTVQLQNWYQRAVLPGQLEAKLTVAGVVVSTVTYDIEQTNKSALEPPTITFVDPMPGFAEVNPAADGDNWKYSIKLGAAVTETILPYQFFMVSPVDYSPVRIYLEPVDAVSTKMGDAYQHTSQHFYKGIASGGRSNRTNPWNASGNPSMLGSGELVAFYAQLPASDDVEEESETIYMAAYNAAKATGENRLLIDVAAGSAFRLEGLKLNAAAVPLTGVWEFFTPVRNATNIPMTRFITAIVSKDGGAPEEVPFSIKDGGVWKANPDWSSKTGGIVVANDILIGDFSGTIPEYAVVGNFATGAGGAPTSPLVSGTFNVATADINGWRPNIIRTFTDNRTSITCPSYSEGVALGATFSDVVERNPGTANAYTQGVRNQAGDVKVTLTHKKHFLEQGWTFDLTIKTVLEANRNTLLVSDGVYWQPAE